MKLTAELSLYPLQEGYIDIIKTFIANLSRHSDITVVPNAMSTQVCGEYDRVMALIGDELLASYETHGRQVLVCKLIPGELAIRPEK